MNSIEKNLHELNKLQDLQQRSHWMNRLHPLGKLLVCVMYILIVASFNKYDLQGVIMMAVFIVFGFIAGELSFREGLYRVRLILPLVLFVGVFNPIFDRQVLMEISLFSGIHITTGEISMATLMLKGFYSVMSAYILIATTSIEQICYALRLLHVPKIIVIVILLIYRYFGLMGKEADRITTAYMLRAPGQKGINYKAWGTLVGQWLLRSMDRAEMVYESMLLRGFRGEFAVKKCSAGIFDILYSISWIIIFAAIRILA